MLGNESKSTAKNEIENQSYIVIPINLLGISVGF